MDGGSPLSVHKEGSTFFSGKRTPDVWVVTFDNFFASAEFKKLAQKLKRDKCFKFRTGIIIIVVVTALLIAQRDEEELLKIQHPFCSLFAVQYYFS